MKFLVVFSQLSITFMCGHYNHNCNYYPNFLSSYKAKLIIYITCNVRYLEIDGKFTINQHDINDLDYQYSIACL